MRVSTKNIYHTSTRWVPRQGINDALAQAVNPPWSGEQTVQLSSFIQALYPRPKEFTVSFLNSITGETQNIPLQLTTSFDVNSNIILPLGYHNNAIAFMWESNLFTLFNSIGGNISNCIVRIFPLTYTLYNIVGNPSAILPPIPNPPITNFYALSLNCPFNVYGPTYNGMTVLVGNMYPDNQCPGFGVPDLDPSWTTYGRLDLSINIGPPLLGEEIITRITVTDWEAIS